MTNQLTSQKQRQHDSWKVCVTLGTIDRLFLKLTARYGSRWTSQLDDVDLLKITKAEWFEKLKHFTNQNIKTGLDNWDGDWPPNIIEFKRVCRPAPCYKTYEQKALPPPIHKNVGNEALTHLRDILK